MNSWFFVNDPGLTPWQILLMSREDIYKAVRQSDLETNSKHILDVFHDEVKIVNNNSSKVFIGGFSQGAIMSHASFLLLEDAAPGGIISFSGLQALDPTGKNVDAALKRKTPMMCYHGVIDTTVPIVVAQTTYGYYNDIDFNNNLTTELTLSHAISSAGEEKMRQFLGGLMTGEEVEKWKEE